MTVFNVQTILVLSVLLGTGGLIGAYLIKRSAARSALTEERERLQLQRIRPVQEEIGKLEAQSTRSREDFDKAVEAYNAKYRNTNANSKPTGGPGSQG